jgi:hypothetical protein
MIIAAAQHHARLRPYYLCPDQEAAGIETQANIDVDGKNRGRYDRSALRYPSDLTDDEWALLSP